MGRRILFASLGLLAVALAVVGAIVPGMPSTVFAIAAAWCFARSVPAWERRLLANRLLGPTLRRFRETGGMSRSAKRAAIACMWVSVAISGAALARTSPAAAAAAFTLAGVGTLVLVYRIPTVLDVSAAAAPRPLHGPRGSR
jgi:uncharacterized membrane protein YbaN (DUF454 family)